ncbi:MAG: hypothetical protein GPJ54_10825, partial [Candidatus Heimdallarchaeota archaeon]|nr:hypothetical protein [Candidatus Heimdallarchaeota archaeon]
MTNISVISTSHDNVESNQSITLDQEYSESDFFYSKLFLESGKIVPNGFPEDLGLSIASDSQNNIIIGGATTREMYPVQNGFNNTFGGTQDGFVTKMSEDGEIIWSTFIGGSKDDVVTSIVIGNDDSVYVNGYTESFNFPITPSAFQLNFGGSRDVFLMKFDPQGVLNWSTYVGGEKREGSFSDGGGGKNNLALDSKENIILSGTTSSDDFPINFPYQPNFGGGTSDAFLSMFNNSGEQIWSTYIGGSFSDIGADLTIDGQDNIIIVGKTESPDFPVLNPFDPTLSETTQDGFVSKFSSQGNLLWSTHQGGDICISSAPCGGGGSTMTPNAVVTNAMGHIIVGSTSALVDNPTPNGYQKTFQGGANGYISKYDENGTLFYGSYYGESGRNEIIDLQIDANDNLLVALLSSDDTIAVKNSYYSFPRDGSNFGAEDPRLLKFDNNNELLWSTDYVSPITTEGTMEIAIDKMGRILTTGYISCEVLCPSTGLPGIEQQISLVGSSPFLQIIKLDPIGDQDGDDLKNYEEFHAKSSPKNPDTDNDGLMDGEEVHTHLSNPILSDSDNDGLDDKYEIDQQYDPNSNDTDSDGMLDEWEDRYKLDPTYENDALVDLDFDDLNNLGEFKAGTDPKIKDTDGDGMNDGYEVKNNLDPLKDDSNGDRDNDFLPNKFEHDYGLNPDSPIETIIAGLVFVLLISSGTYFFIRSKRLNAEAKRKGYKDLKERNKTEKRGFNSLDDLKQAETLGFKSKSAQTIIQAARYDTVDMMIEDWKFQINSAEKSLNTINLNELEKLVNLTTSPINLHEVELSYKDTTNELNKILKNFKSIIALQEGINNLELIDDELPLIDFSSTQLSKLRNEVNDVSNNLSTTITNLSHIFEVRKQWFIPWQQLLTLIQMTQDGLPIELSKITEVILCSDDQA